MPYSITVLEMDKMLPAEQKMYYRERGGQCFGGLLIPASECGGWRVERKNDMYMEHRKMLACQEKPVGTKSNFPHLILEFQATSCKQAKKRADLG